MFETLIMQIPEVDSIIGLIQAVGILLGTVGAIVTPIMYSFKKKIDKSNERANFAADLGIKVGQLSTAFSQKTAEQEDEIRMVVETLHKMSPEEVKQFLTNNRTSIDRITHRAIAANDQFIALTRALPEQAKANNLRSLPR